MKLRLSITNRVLIASFIILAVTLGVMAALTAWTQSIYLSVLLTALSVWPVSVWLILVGFKSANKSLQALNDGFQNFLDNDFSVSIVDNRNDEIGDLIKLYNRVSQALRKERVYLYQRELLLDTVIQTTSLALVLLDYKGRIIYSNQSSKQLFSDSQPINGEDFSRLLENKPDSYRQAVDSGLSGLFTVEEKTGSETYYLTQNHFLLNGQNHQLLLFKRLTQEINRQEVNTWKKVIRLISHELNNTLAPIRSLGHSGQKLSEREGHEKLKSIFSTIEERAKHLQSFIEGYAKFARLPKPNLETIELSTWLSNLRQLSPFQLHKKTDIPNIKADPAQLEQALINLLKNAHEAGGDPSEVALRVEALNSHLEISVLDRGSGMNDKQVESALLPFYSTKMNGTGLGLPLCREIVEAHGGKMMIGNRAKGGCKITLMLPV